MKRSSLSISWTHSGPAIKRWGIPTLVNLMSRRKASCDTKIEDCAKDSRWFHALVNNLTSKKAEEEWPEHTSSNQLAKDFAIYFQGKIEKIRETLKNKPKYNSPETDAPHLVCFAPNGWETWVSVVITSLKSKSSELDAIPTSILKKMLSDVIPLITKIVQYLTYWWVLL